PRPRRRHQRHPQIPTRHALRSSPRVRPHPRLARPRRLVRRLQPHHGRPRNPSRRHRHHPHPPAPPTPHQQSRTRRHRRARRTRTHTHHRERGPAPHPTPQPTPAAGPAPPRPPPPPPLHRPTPPDPTTTGHQSRSDAPLNRARPPDPATTRTPPPHTTAPHNENGPRSPRSGAVPHFSREPGTEPGNSSWWRGWDLNPRPSGYEPDELPD